MSDSNGNTPPRCRIPADFESSELPDGFLEFFRPLHDAFASRRAALVAKRGAVLEAAHEGDLPSYLPDSEARTGDWRIELPAWCQDQRNQMTGPADDGPLVVKMVNSGAPGVMIDLEDSIVNDIRHVLRGVENILGALYGTLSYEDKKRDRTVSIVPSSTVIFSRVRGLHLGLEGLFGENGDVTSASLFDAALLAFRADKSKLSHPLCLYIPKSESAEEALWWRDLLQTLAERKGWPKGEIKCMALVEAHPLAYQMEEFVYNLRDHLIGLNLGRWDYMASLIHFNFQDPDWVLPDRNTIPSEVPFFQRLRLLMGDTCHRRGIFAIGGMTALYPSRTDAELNERALTGLAKDKKNESDCFMDGAWTGHPDQNAIAVAQFPEPNQIDKLPPDVDRRVDLRPLPKGVGARTSSGTRAAIRTVIRYRNGVLAGRGASLLDGYMEDLATDRIYRLMIGQRVRHRDAADVTNPVGDPVRHGPLLIERLFAEETERLKGELPEGATDEDRARIDQASRQSLQMIARALVDPV